MKNKLRTAIVFLTGVLVTTCFFQFVYPPPEKAYAEKFHSCLYNDLVPTLTDGDIGKYKKFSVYYSLPTCYAANGYNVKKTFIYEGQYVAVTYENPNFTKSAGFGGSSGGGGLAPLN